VPDFCDNISPKTSLYRVPGLLGNISPKMSLYRVPSFYVTEIITLLLTGAISEPEVLLAV